MDALDAPFDPNLASGPVGGGPHFEAPGALSTPCLPPSIARSLAARMAAGTLSAEDIRGPGRQLVRHLLRGCPDCAVAFGVGAGLPATIRPLPLFYYEAKVNRAIRRTLEDWRGREAGAKHPGKTFERERAEALLAEARKLRRDDPEFGIDLLDEALRRAKMPAARCADGEATPEDLACEIHTERANLFRLLGRHPEAELAFQSALGSWRDAAGAAESLVNLGDRYASLLIDRRRFGEADGLLANLIALFTRRGDVAHAGKLALKRSLAAAYSGDPGRALRLASEALRLLNGTETLELQINATQHIVGLYVELGNFQDASDCADEIRAELHRHMGESDRAKFLFYDAQIYYGLGRPNLAAELLRRVKAQFEELGLPFQAAIVGLDLAVKLVERDRPAEARALIAKELIPTFRAIGVAREGLASLVLLERATEAAALDAALLKSVLRDLERAGQELGPKRREDDEDYEGPDSA